VTLTIDFEEDPFIKQLLAQIKTMAEQIRMLEISTPVYVPEEVACTLTGLSRTTLWRERKRTGSLIKWKQDHGVRYLRASLLAYNESRAVGR
jgi:hypothetical protein